MESEFLAGISRRQRVFLTRTAVLERMCGPLCDAVLGLSGSAACLAELARSNVLLIPLDRRGKWYRYHHLFRDMLLAELDRMDPPNGTDLIRRVGGHPAHAAGADVEADRLLGRRSPLGCGEGP
jgi:LuxR family transcriptional regulator, maltose regulon positive regulatory protein